MKCIQTNAYYFGTWTYGESEMKQKLKYSSCDTEQNGVHIFDFP